MFRLYKYRLFTNASQERELAAMLETHRRLYNQALDGKQLLWETAAARWTWAEQCRWYTIQRRLNPYFARLNSSSAQRTLTKLDKAYTAFFRRGGLPRFKSRDRFDSFSFDVAGKGGGCKIIDRKLRLQYVGTIRVRWHRELPEGAKIKQATILRECGKWLVCFSIDLPDAGPTKLTESVGIDVGLKSFVTTSDGKQLGDSRTLERKLPELRRRHRALKRCDRSSKRRQFVKQRVARLYAKVRNVRRDMHHKVARSLVTRYAAIAAESLNVAGMLRNRRLARRIADAGWGQFISILCSKAEGAGCKVVLVDAKNTSQQCSSCGEIVRKSLAVRVHRCECGCVLDRDVNAARNILGRAGPDGLNELVAIRGHKSHCLTVVE